MPIAGGTLVDGRYFIRDRVGSGAMGVVYRAEDVGLGRLVAIKLIDAAAAKAPGSIDRFINEARALARVKHDNVVRIFSYGVHDGTPFFVMEHLDGPTLDTQIDDAWKKGTTLPIEETLATLRALATGLDEVHMHGLVHRDVKPANVIVDGKPPRPCSSTSVSCARRSDRSVRSRPRARRCTWRRSSRPMSTVRR